MMDFGTSSHVLFSLQKKREHGELVREVELASSCFWYNWWNGKGSIDFLSLSG